ncbi:MAG TPA: hypothetical protein DIT13_15255 [Verrucomicrobiales bacterium]|nr:hypothetical protein [Verrucomicrobiales bacterium]
MASFHLVAANFFPWITQWTWGDLNSIEESILLRGSGHPDSVGHVVGLIQKIRPQVVMFHGANNAAPGLGWHVMDRLCGPSWNRADCKFVFSDNLAPPNRAISNAVMTPCPVGRHNLPPGFEA